MSDDELDSDLSEVPADSDKPKGALYVADLRRTKNIADQLSKEQRALVGRLVCDSTKADIESCSEHALRRAFWRKQFVGTPEPSKRRKFKGSCNAHVPMLTVATMQFDARAEEYLLPSRGIVRAKEYSKSRKAIARAERVGDFQQDQIESQIRGFRRTHGLAFTQCAIDGSAFLKAFWDPSARAPEVVVVPAEDIIVSYTHSGTIAQAARITQRLRMTRDDIRLRGNDGRFLTDEAWSLEHGDAPDSGGPLDEIRRKTDGVEPPQSLSHEDDMPRELYEQHRMLDLDGDGIGEPYIVTVDKQTTKLLRITSRMVKNKSGKDEEVKHFVMYPFQWNPAGFYPLGLGHLLEGLGVVADSLVQQLVDAGTIANSPGGFIAKQANTKRGDVSYEPGEFVEFSGYIEDLRKAIMVMPTTQPSSTLKEVLGMTQEWAREITSISDIMQGLEQPTNQTATTSLLMAKQGLTLFNAIFRRLRDALTELLQLIFQLNRLFLDQETYCSTLGDNGQPEYAQWVAQRAQYGQMLQVALEMQSQGAQIPPDLQTLLQEAPPELPFSVDEDFADTVDIMPTADPEVTSEAERVSIAQQVLQIVMDPNDPQPPRSRWAAKRRLLEALRVPDIEEVMPPPQEPEPPPNLGQYAEIANMLDGKPAPVPPERPPQYHVEHLTQVGEYKQRDGGFWVQAMAPEQKDALDRHERGHLAELLRIQDQGQQQQGGPSAGVPLPATLTHSAPASGPPPAGMGQPPGGALVPGAAGGPDLRGAAPPSLLGRLPALGELLAGPGGGAPQGA